jgi:hypothetical protein
VDAHYFDLAGNYGTHSTVTNHLKGLQKLPSYCNVNGLKEMADADFDM